MFDEIDAMCRGRHVCSAALSAVEYSEETLLKSYNLDSSIKYRGVLKVSPRIKGERRAISAIMAQVYAQITNRIFLHRLITGLYEHSGALALDLTPLYY